MVVGRFVVFGQWVRGGGCGGGGGNGLVTGNDQGSKRGLWLEIQREHQGEKGMMR